MTTVQKMCVAAFGLVVAMQPVVAQELAEAVTTKREMIVTANPLATAAGAKILKNGGTAVDAMVAAQVVLGLVEPQSSGLGGGAFAVYYDATTGELTTFDGREKAPAAAAEDRFVDFRRPGGFADAWQSGLSVGVPGTPRLMEVMHQRYGKKNWARVLQPGISLAQSGFELTERTSSQVAGLLARNTDCDDRLFFRDPAAFAYFANRDGSECSAKPAGTRIRNKAYANTLKAIRNGGADAFYTGEIAEDIAEAVQGDLNIAGDMTTADLAAYQVIERAPVCLNNYRGYKVCGMGPPSSGAIAVGQILGILQSFELGDDPLNEQTVHRFALAGCLAFADRGLYVADSDFVTVPVDAMLNESYLAGRATLIEEKYICPASPGNPPGVFDPTMPDPTAKTSGTSHISIVDRYGNALSMTTTIESSFGNGVLVRGFLLNNELTDFSFDPGTPEAPVANRVQANKRPRSSMSPTIVLNDDGSVELVTGSPGGSRIIGYTAQSIVNHIDFGLDPQESINTPHYQNRNGSTGTELETPIPGITLDYDRDALRQDLIDRGHVTRDSNTLTSGLSIIHVDGDVLVGGADKRRDGEVGGR